MAEDTEFEIDAELLAGFVDEAEEGLEAVDGLFVTLENDLKDVETINAIFRPIHTVKGNAAFFGLMSTKRLAHEMETVLTLARDRLAPGRPLDDFIRETISEEKTRLARTATLKSEGRPFSYGGFTPIAV